MLLMRWPDDELTFTTSFLDDFDVYSISAIMMMGLVSRMLLMSSTMLMMI